MPRAKSKTKDTVGKRIKKARLAKKISLENIANETGMSTAYLKKVESGDMIPPVGALLQISRALQIDSGDLLKEQQDSLNKRIKEYTKRTENYAYTTLTPGAENKHLKAFKVTVDPQTDHKGVGYCHQGEEFVYVLKGQIEVTVGEHKNKLKKGDSLHFNSGIQHCMRNIGKSVAEMLVVIYGP